MAKARKTQLVGQPAAAQKRKSADSELVVAGAPALLFTLEVSIISGAMSGKYQGKIIARTIQILGSHTLDDLHGVIFDGFNREEEHLWEFLVGGKHRGDRNNTRYGPAELEDDEAHDASETRLDSLMLKEGSRFGYIFDFGDDWEHSVVVSSIEKTTIMNMEPKVIKKTGKAPPQYGSLW